MARLKSTKTKAFYGSSNVALKLSELKSNYRGLDNIICVDTDKHTDYVLVDAFREFYRVESSYMKTALYLHINQCYGGLYHDGVKPIMFYIDCKKIEPSKLHEILETIALHKYYIEPIIILANLEKIIPFYGDINRIMESPYKTEQVKHDGINFFINFRAFREQKLI